MSLPVLRIVSMRWWMCLILLLLVAGNAAAGGEERRLQSTLYDYGGVFRWGDMGQILAFFDQDPKAAKAPTTFDIERWKQWKVVGYRPKPYAMFEDGRAIQIVEIELSNVNTQTTRTLTDRQLWRYDKPNKSWLLTSGLPNLSQ